MVFMDGTWLYYSLFDGGRANCPLQRKLGANWVRDYRVDWNKVIQVIESSLSTQLFYAHGYTRLVEIIRTYVFTSTRADTSIDGKRSRLIADFEKANFDVQRLLTKGSQEKCVDISLAVEMLYMATVPDGYDIAVIVTGDKDFIPAMQKTRMKGKRVAVCSQRNSCNRDLTNPSNRLKDFDVIWLDDYIDEIIAPMRSDPEGTTGSDDAIVELLRKFLARQDGSASSRDVGRYLNSAKMDGHQDTDARTLMRRRYPSLRSFLEKYYEVFDIEEIEKKPDGDYFYEYRVILSEEEGEEEEEEEEEERLETQSEREREREGDDVSSRTCEELRAALRESGLSVSGRKEQLIRRLRESGDTGEPLSSDLTHPHPHHDPQEETELVDDERLKREREKERERRGDGGAYENENGGKVVRETDSESGRAYKAGTESAEDEDQWILGLIRDFVAVSETETSSSRLIGKYLQIIPGGIGGNALSHLKRHYGSLSKFISAHPETFQLLDAEKKTSSKEFIVKLVTGQPLLESTM
eukprot:CAMPEP_0182419078 /NCGR_PEP_ID=MMETSP1167-20130531/3472_1 /TAXON_ID=2988 /ORGANISM="Mallomonas Sp, Strain CCMP3275" /LENGTH=524 /DNA_ID=CAMNT_0024593685 /DNA_START=289 /DNA_END=1863 /DNA_ORIENTATION=-